jgi:hypothetical protein
MRKLAMFIVMAALASIELPHLAAAVTYGNLARKFAPGKLEAGIQVSQTKRDLDVKATIDTSIGSDEATDKFTADFNRQAVQIVLGVADNLGIGAQFGNIELKDEDGAKISGQEFGGSIWHRFEGSQSGFDSGVLLSVRTATIADKWQEGRSTQIDLGFGGSKPISDSGSLYFNFIYSKFSMTLDATSRTKQDAADYLSYYNGSPVTVSKLQVTFDESSAFLLVVGGEFKVSPKASISIELHAMAESGFALGLLFGF